MGGGERRQENEFAMVLLKHPLGYSSEDPSTTHSRHHHPHLTSLLLKLPDSGSLKMHLSIWHLSSPGPDNPPTVLEKLKAQKQQPLPLPFQTAANLCPTCRRTTLSALQTQGCLSPARNLPPAGPRRPLHEPTLGPFLSRARDAAPAPPPAARVLPHLTYPLSGAGLHLSLRHVGPRSEPLRLPARWRRNLSGPQPPPTLQE